VTFKVYRCDPAAVSRRAIRKFPVEYKKGDTVLDALNEIKAHQDATLSFRRSCRSGICGSCAMKINGLNHLACETQIEHLKTGWWWSNRCPASSRSRIWRWTWSRSTSPA